MFKIKIEIFNLKNTSIYRHPNINMQTLPLKNSRNQNLKLT